MDEHEVALRYQAKTKRLHTASIGTLYRDGVEAPICLTIRRHEGGNNTSSLDVWLTAAQARDLATKLLNALSPDPSSWWVMGDENTGEEN